MARLSRVLGATGPTYAILLSLPVLSLAGLPPLVGFIAKYLTIYLTFSSDLIFIAVILLVFSILSLFYYLRFVHYIFFVKTAREAATDEPHAFGAGSLEFGAPTPNLKPSASADALGLYQSYVAVAASVALLFFSFNPSLLFLTASVFSSLVS